MSLGSLFKFEGISLVRADSLQSAHLCNLRKIIANYFYSRTILTNSVSIVKNQPSATIGNRKHSVQQSSDAKMHVRPRVNKQYNNM